MENLIPKYPILAKFLATSGFKLNEVLVKANDYSDVAFIDEKGNLLKYVNHDIADHWYFLEDIEATPEEKKFYRENYIRTSVGESLLLEKGSPINKNQQTAIFKLFVYMSEHFGDFNIYYDIGPGADVGIRSDTFKVIEDIDFEAWDKFLKELKDKKLIE